MLNKYCFKKWMKRFNNKKKIEQKIILFYQNTNDRNGKLEWY